MTDCLEMLQVLMTRCLISSAAAISMRGPEPPESRINYRNYLDVFSVPANYWPAGFHEHDSRLAWKTLILIQTVRLFITSTNNYLFTLI